MSNKITIITTDKVPENLAEALSYHDYNFEAVSAFDMINFNDSGTIVIDTSKRHPNLEKCQKGFIPSEKTSFFSNLERFKSLNTREYITDFLSKIGGDISINHKKYNFFGETRLLTEYGNFILFGFQSRTNGNNVLGLRTAEMPTIPTVRTHSMCYTGDIFHSLKCDCREELENALKLVNERGGMLIYPEEEGRGIGILNKIRIYQFQDRGADTVEAQYLGHFPNDLRNYDYLKDVFFYFGITAINLITNNPEKVIACYDSGVSVLEVIKVTSTITEYNRGYLKTKMQKSGHDFSVEFATN